MSNELITKPSYLTEVSTSDLQKDALAYSKTPFIKIIQQNAVAPYKPPFNEADIIVAPELKKIGDQDNSFTFVPIYFFPSFHALNPYSMKNMLPMFREVSFDENSDLAKKCKKVGYTEPCPEKATEQVKFKTALNFLIILEDIESHREMPVAIFFNGGEYKTGQILLSMLNSPSAPFFARRIRAVSAIHPNKQNTKVYGLNLMNDPQMWVSEENFNRYRALKVELEDAVKTNRFALDPGALAEGDDAATETKF